MTNCVLFAAAILASTFRALPAHGQVRTSRAGFEIVTSQPHPFRAHPPSRKATGGAGQTDSVVDDSAHDHGGHALPTLLSTIDPESGGRLVNALNNSLYDLLLNPTTSFDITLAKHRLRNYAQADMRSESGTDGSEPTPDRATNARRFANQEGNSERRDMSPTAAARRRDRPVYASNNARVVLTVDKRSLSFHEPLTISWHVEYDETRGVGEGGTSTDRSGDDASASAPVGVGDDDVIAMYCPADEVDPRMFRDAATVRQARAYATATASSPSTGAAHSHGGEPRDRWIIPSFPIVREESCEFRLWRRRTGGVAGDSLQGISPMGLRLKGDDSEAYSQRTRRANGEQQHQSNQFQLVATSGAIDLERRSMMKPTGVHLALTSNFHEMNVHFTTGDHRRRGHHQAGESQIVPVVRYARRPPRPTAESESLLSEGDGGIVGDDSTDDDPENAYVIVAGTTTTYEASDMCMSPANETGPGKFVDPGLLHVVTLTNLMPNTDYEYEPGVLLISSSYDEGQPAGGQIREEGGGGRRSVHREYSWSDKKNVFRSAPTVGPVHEPFHFLVYGDQGCPETGWAMGARSVMKRLEREISVPIRSGTSSALTSSYHSSHLGAVHHFGDIAYAKGVAHIWDFWMHMVEPLSASVPLMIGVGNHEYDHTAGGQDGKDPSGVKTPGGFSPSFGNFLDDSGGECGVPVSNRFVMPDNGNGIFWYSFDYASTHIVMLSSEHDLSPTSRQYAWLHGDLENVNRTVTPWLIVEIHRPLYNSFNRTADNKVGIGMREEFEPILLEFGVDLVLAGHYHSYLRTCSGLYRGICGSGGPTYITVGTAGAKLSVANIYSQTWTEAYFSEWGYGRVTVANDTALHFEFVSDDANGTVKDDVWIKKR